MRVCILGWCNVCPSTSFSSLQIWWVKWPKILWSFSIGGACLFSFPLNLSTACDGDQENTAEMTLPWLLGRFYFLFTGSAPEPPHKQLSYSAEKVMWRAQGARASWGFQPPCQGIEPVRWVILNLAGQPILQPDTWATPVDATWSRRIAYLNPLLIPDPQIMKYSWLCCCF